MDGVEDRDAYCDFEGAGGTMAELKILHSNLMAFLESRRLPTFIRESGPTSSTVRDMQASRDTRRYGRR